MKDAFLTFREIREKLDVSRTTLWRWCSERGLKVVRVGNVARIRVSDFEAFLARNESVECEAVNSKKPPMVPA